MSDHGEILADSLALMNVARAAYGKAPLNDFPSAQPGNAHGCLFHQGLQEIGAEAVPGDVIVFKDKSVATHIAALWGQPLLDDQAVKLPQQMNEVVNLFDSHSLSHYDTQVIEPT